MLLFFVVIVLVLKFFKKVINAGALLSQKFLFDVVVGEDEVDGAAMRAVGFEECLIHLLK